MSIQTTDIAFVSVTTVSTNGKHIIVEVGVVVVDGVR
jgi:hypothetical protein